MPQRSVANSKKAVTENKAQSVLSLPGSICRGSKCESGCIESVSCQAGSYCSSEGNCLAGCLASSDCDLGAFCQRDGDALSSGLCVEGCTESDDRCEKGKYCQDGICVTGCKLDIHCPVTLVLARKVIRQKAYYNWQHHWPTSRMPGQHQLSNQPVLQVRSVRGWLRL